MCSLRTDQPTSACAGNLDPLILFCNGIRTTHDEARAHCDKLEEKIGLKVSLIHNLEFSGCENKECLKTDVVSRLALSIQEEIERNPSALVKEQISVIVLTHSHGGVIVEKALKIFADVVPHYISCIAVATFGTPQVLKKSLCARVHNYIYRGDHISTMANLPGYLPEGFEMSEILVECARSFFSCSLPTPEDDEGKKSLQYALGVEGENGIGYEIEVLENPNSLSKVPMRAMIKIHRFESYIGRASEVVRGWVETCQSID